MRLLLDTHTLVWALTAPERLGPEVAPLIRARETELIVSAASAWEVATKVRIGTLPGATRLIDAFDEHLQRLGVTELPMSRRHALLAGSMAWSHRDAFDRMLAAQAISEDLTLATRDPVAGRRASALVTHRRSM